MDPINQQLAIAARRLLVSGFLRRWGVLLCVTMSLALLAIGVRKLVDFDVDSTLWAWSWIGGAFAVGTLAALTIALLHRPKQLEVALEVDQRFQLRERVSSALAMDDEVRATPAGGALLQDAVRRAERLDVATQFPISGSRRLLWPLVPAAGAFALMFLADPTGSKTDAQAATEREALAKQLNESTEPLKKQLSEQRKQAEEQGLKDAAELLKMLETEAQKLAEQTKKGELNREQAVTKLNDLAKKIAERQEKLGGQEQLKQQLNNLKQPGEGPAQSMASAMKNADFEKAADEINKLADKLNDPKMSDEDKQKLAEQLEKMKDQLDKQAAAQQAAQEQLKQQIDQLNQQSKQAAADGNKQQADQLQQQAQNLQQQLDQLQQQQGQMNQAQQLAQQLQNAAEGLRNGNQQQAQQAMQNMQQQMNKLAQQNQQMQTLQQAMEMISECKGNCSGNGQPGQQNQQQAQNGKQSPNGQQPGQKGQGQQPGQSQQAGQQPGQGNQPGQSGQPGAGNLPGQNPQGSQIVQGGSGDSQGDPNGIPGSGLGQGPGAGARPINPNDVKFRDTKANLDIGQGQAQITGEAGGPNQKGNVQERIKLEVEASKSESAEAVNRQRLPKHQRDQVKEYFDSLREGK